VSTATASRRRGRQRELRYAEHLEERYGGLARRFESGCFDIVWLRPGQRPALVQMKSTVTPYAHFGPDERAAAVEQAEQAGAEAVLVWWPKGKSLRSAEWIPASEWP
jgi:hypothetical protein